MTPAWPAVDVVIAVHDSRRRLDRAVSSVLASTPEARVTVVAHGLPSDAVVAMLGGAPDDRVRIIEFADGVHSPSGPFNRGLQEASAEFVMIMGSDDFVEDGALDAWLAATRATKVDVQMAPLRYQDGELLLNPLTRPLRRRELDPVRDRLFYRTAPLALIRRSIIDSREPLTPDMPVGGDLAWSTRLWTSGATIGLDLRHPAYVIGSDAEERVTTTPRPIDDVIAPVHGVLTSEWASAQPPRVRASLVAKLLRVNVIGALRARPRAEDWTGDSSRKFAQLIRRVEAYAPTGAEDLPRGDRAVLDAAASEAVDTQSLVDAIAAYRRMGRMDRLVPRRWWRAFGRESVLRRYARYAWEGMRR